MVVFEIVGGNEADPIYQSLEIDNGNRQYSFLSSLVGTSLKVQRAFLSSHIIKALNFQAITCLHTYAGEYRPCRVTVGPFEPPEHYRVQALMDDFVNSVNRIWEATDAIALASLVLWRLNYIHPFINGNGRTARATCYFVLCVKFGGWLPGQSILPELLRREHARYVDALKKADESVATGPLDLSVLHALISELLAEQISGSAGAQPNSSPPPSPALQTLLLPPPVEPIDP